jgi:hypothetical protein
MQTTAGEADRDERCGHILRAIPAMPVPRSTYPTPDPSVSAAAGQDPAGILPGVRFPNRSSAETVDDGSVPFGRPQRGDLTLDGDSHNTAAEKSLSASRQR